MAATILLAATPLTASAAERPTGTVTGQVSYGPHRKPLPYAIVYLGARAATGSNLAPVTVEVRNGRVRPRIQVARGGADLVLRNSDPTLHLVRLEWIGQGSVARPLQRVAMPYAGYRKRFRLPRHDQTRLLRIVGENGETKLRGYVALLPHSYAAVTDRHGLFTIPRIPANRYPIHAWHEQLGALAHQIEVRPGQQAKVALEYR